MLPDSFSIAKIVFEFRHVVTTDRLQIEAGRRPGVKTKVRLASPNTTGPV
jgi:hypothetical protein